MLGKTLVMLGKQFENEIGITCQLSGKLLSFILGKKIAFRQFVDILYRLCDARKMGQITSIINASFRK